VPIFRFRAAYRLPQKVPELARCIRDELTAESTRGIACRVGRGPNGPQKG